MKNVMLYFGSFNPIHKGHIAIAEYAVEHKLCDEVILIVSPQNPHKAAPELAAELQRFEMAEIACSKTWHEDAYLFAFQLNAFGEIPSYQGNRILVQIRRYFLMYKKYFCLFHNGIFLYVV